VEAVTQLYAYPGALVEGQDRADVDAALAKLSAELDLPHTLKLKGGSQITVPDTAPAETWAAIERAVPDWPDLFLPRSVA
jgi:hypothetical protein